MTNNDILRMAVEAGFADAQGVVHAAYQLERFANLVADAEREACAKLVEEYFGVGHEEGEDCALVIRQRSQS